MSKTLEKAREWAREWPVGSDALFFIGSIRGWSPVTVLEHRQTPGTVMLKLRTPEGRIYYCSYGLRRDLRPLPPAQAPTRRGART